MLVLVLYYGNSQLRSRRGDRLNVLHVCIGLIIISQRSIEPCGNLSACID
jgi:hypothetical protein